MVPLPVIAEVSLPISFAIIVAALTIALSTRVRRWGIYIGRLIISPWEEVDVENASWSATEEMGNTSNEKTQTKKRLRRYKQHKPEEDYLDIDFWKPYRDRGETKYNIPAQNRLPVADGKKKKRHGGRSTFSSFTDTRRRRGERRKSLSDGV